MRRSVDADKLMDELGRLATDTDLCKRYGNCTPWIPYSAVRKLISDMILEAKESCDDAVNRQEAIDKIKKRLFETAFNNVGIRQNIDETLVDVAENRLENWFNELPPIQPKQNEMIKEIRRWINSGNRGNADYFIVDRIEEIINLYEIN